MNKKNIKGVSFIEIMIVIGIVAGLAMIGGLNLLGVYKQRALENDAAQIAFSLRAARTKSITQENTDQWGVRLDNSSTSGFYEIFYGPTYNPNNIMAGKNLNPSVQFVNPAPGNYLDISFSKIYGLPSNSTSIIISLKGDSSRQKIITINNNGEVNY